MSFAKLKSNRAAELAKLTSHIEKLSAGGGNDQKDNDRFWSLTVDKSGNGSAEIRFLPAPDGEDVPFIRYFDHGFKGPTGSWYIENSLSSIGKEDPVSEMNRKLWAQGENSEGRKIVSGEGKDKPGSKRRLHYIANIYVVKDPGNPDNEGKVFLYKFGAKIYDKVNAAMHPEFDNEVQINPFDLWEGANFYLRAAQVKGYRNYDKSAFASQSALFDDDAQLEEVWKKEYPLQSFLDESNFKSYDELKAKLARVMEGMDEATGSTSRPADKQVAKPKPMKTKEAPVEETVDGSDADMDDDSMKFFQSLAEED